MPITVKNSKGQIKNYAHVLYGAIDNFNLNNCQDLILMRFSDVVLMAAEAANEKNIPGEAVDYLEMVRARARGTNTNILPKITTNDQGELREAIRHERRVELGLEPDRFYDLVRWGIASEVLHAAGKVNYQDKNALLPLPQSEIDKSKGVLVQNPDY